MMMTMTEHVHERTLAMSNFWVKNKKCFVKTLKVIMYIHARHPFEMWFCEKLK